MFLHGIFPPITTPFYPDGKIYHRKLEQNVEHYSRTPVAGIVVLVAVIGHHRAANAEYVLFDTGWQFQMALQEPLTLDAAQVSAAAALSH